MQHVAVTDLLAGQDAGVLWSSTSQLQSNVVALPVGARVDEHVETALDVLLVVVAGSGRLTHSRDGRAAVEQDLSAPSVCLLPAGTRRSLRAGPDGLVLVTAHRPRPPFLPGHAPPS